MSDHPLDNMVWSTLTTHHADIAERFGSAAAYPRDVNVFHAVERCDPTGWSDLAELAGPGRVVVLFRGSVPPPPAGWAVLDRGTGAQMAFEGHVADGPDAPRVEIRPLDDSHAAEMIELATATKPGPFVARTHTLGRFSGVFDGDRLIAMAGERLHAAGYHEISAVCTDAAARGRGLAAALTLHVARGIAADGERPMLHVAATNVGARRVYERLGFTVRREVDFAVLRTPS